MKDENLVSTTRTTIGLKLRGLRAQKGLTLSRLAIETGLSTALLSKLETERMIPTLSTLASIGRVYGVGLGFFFADAKKHSLSTTRKLNEIRRGKKQEMIKQFALTAEVDSSLLAREVDFPPGVAAVLTQAGKGSSGVIYVLEGSLQLNSSGTRDVLERGDCVCLDSEMLITWGADGKSRCRALVILQGEKASSDRRDANLMPGSRPFPNPGRSLWKRRSSPAGSTIICFRMLRR